MLLRRYDPEKRMNRWYKVEIQSTLIDPVAVVCTWGSWKTAYQRAKTLPMDSHEEALNKAEKIIESKLKRGYQVLG